MRLVPPRNSHLGTVGLRVVWLDGQLTSNTEERVGYDCQTCTEEGKSGRLRAFGPLPSVRNCGPWGSLLFLP